jgi:hypothetical protein
MRLTARHLCWSAAVATALALPAATRAQQPLDPIQVSARTAEADRLDARAQDYETSGSRRKWGKAAGLRERAADLRAPEDPRGFSSLQMAAFLRHAISQREAALGLMQRAGDQAIARGDVYNAARAYVDAAYIANEMRDVEDVRAFIAKGTLLMHSPLLSDPQREQLRRGLAQASVPGAQLASAVAAP